jgi:hypothetical protein
MQCNDSNDIQVRYALGVRLKGWGGVAVNGILVKLIAQFEVNLHQDPRLAVLLNTALRIVVKPRMVNAQQWQCLINFDINPFPCRRTR